MKNRKPDFERIVKVLFNKKADAIPLIELGVHPIIKSRILERQFSSILDEIEFNLKMSYDYVKVQPGVKFILNSLELSQKSPETEVKREWAQEKKGVITNWGEFEKYPWPKKEDIDYSRFELAAKNLPDGMGIIGQYGDIFTVAWEMMGFETFSLSLYEAPELPAAIMKNVGELILSMYENMAEMDYVGALWFSDDIAYATGLMTLPDFYRTHFFPFLKRIGDIAKKKSVPFIYHTDGLLWDVMDDIIESGATALHPIEPKAMDIKEVRKKYGDRLALCGGIDLDLLARGTPEEIKAITIDYIESFGKSGGWAAGSSNSITDYVKLENYLAMTQTVLERGNC